jgi:hypothetical protein
METTEIILAYGHENVLATHKTTLAITKNSQLSKRGDCIIAVSANKAVEDLSRKFKQALHRDTAKITILIEADEIAETVNASGNPQLILTHPADIVVRKSSYICNRTLAIQADKAACDLSRKLIERLRDPNQKVKITLTLKI